MAAVPLRVLLVEDSEDDALLVVHELRRGGFEVSWERVETAEAMAEALDRGPWDLILSDFRMPRFSATQALALYRERGIETPFLLVSGTIGEEQAAASLKAGAHDFFLKDRLTRLCPAVERELREANNRRARRRAEEERKASQAALARSEQRLGRLIEFAPEATVITDARGQIVLVNAQTERLFGYRRAELLGRSVEVLVPEPLRGGHETHRAIYMAHPRVRGMTDGGDLYGRRKDGTVFPVEIALSPFETEEGPLVSSSIRDVSERRKAEQALRHSRDLLDLIGQLAKVGGWELDLETETLTWSEGAYRIHEVDPSTRPSLAQAIDFFLPEARPAISAAVRACIDSGTPWDLELPLMTARGRTIWVRAQGVAERQGDRTVRLLGALQDVTDRKRSEEAILKETAFSDAVLDSLPGIFYLFDHTGRFLRWNRYLETVSGYSAEEVGAMHPLAFFTGEDQTLIEETIRKVFETGAAEVEASLASKDGKRTPHYFVGARFAVDGVPCCIGAGIDVTARKHLETQLQQSQKIEAIGRLAGGVAHDFNNLLGVITGYGELAQRQLGPEHPSRPRVDQMIKAAGRAAGLTRQLLAFSRKQVLQPKLLDLNSIVADTHRMLGRLIGEDVTVVVQPAPDLGTVKADPGQIEQIILNLAVNARDAMPKGGTLTLETANVDLDRDYCAAHPPATPGRYVQLAITDTGVGMDQKTLTMIFEPFFTTKPEGQGTGLGLATVYGIVKQSGGHIWVYSEPGRGTTFKVHLPSVDEPIETARPGGAPAEAPRGQETILLVEDAEMLQEVIREKLEESGYTVLLASNGEEALALARERKGPIDLLLTDVVMPKLGGGELAKLLCALRPGMRVLYMSGYTDGAISQHGVLGEGVLLLEKPFTGDQLARLVREALDRPAAPQLRGHQA